LFFAQYHTETPLTVHTNAQILTPHADGMLFPTTKGKLLPLKSGLRAYGGVHMTPSYVIESKMVFVFGLSSGTVAAGSVIACLPVEYRPKKRLRFHTNNHQNVTTLEVRPNGDIILIGTHMHNWINFTGIAYPA